MGENSIVDGDGSSDYLDEVLTTWTGSTNTSVTSRVSSAPTGPAAMPDGQSRLLSTAVNNRSGRGSSSCCTGYYDTSSPIDAQIPVGVRFHRQIIHPQFWPQDFEPDGKRIAVIGSGATAVTLVPSPVKLGARVTMVQRTPSFILPSPMDRSPDCCAANWQRLHGHIRCHAGEKHRAAMRAVPGVPAGKTMRKLLRSGAISGTGSGNVGGYPLPARPVHPGISGCASRRAETCSGAEGTVVRRSLPGNIRTITEGGIELADGTTVSADVIVTRRVSSISLLGKIADHTSTGEPVNGADTVVFRGAMLSGVPNFAFCVGYINLSFTVAPT